MVRREGWPLLLSGYLKNMRKLPFKWGNNDCAMFAANWVVNCTGFDPAEDYRGRYKTEEEALSFGTVESLVTASMGEPSTSMNLAGRGDIVLTKHGACGIIDDSGSKVAVMTVEGMKKIPLSDAVKFWKV